MRIRVGLLAASLLALSCAGTHATGEEPLGNVPDAAPAFAVRAARANAAEIELSRTAFERAFDGQVRSFARTMVIDHSRMDGDLHAIADRRGWDLPNVPDPDHRALED
jgi:predicted outer membrane protein